MEEQSDYSNSIVNHVTAIQFHPVNT